MRALKICLWVAGVSCLLSVFGMFLPVRSIESITAIFGVEAISDSPEVLYGIRVVSATYVAVGAFYIILALHPMKYPTLVPFSALAAVFVGLTCAITGLVTAMPPLWFLCDSISCITLGVLIFVFWRRADRLLNH